MLHDSSADVSGFPTLPLLPEIFIQPPSPFLVPYYANACSCHELHNLRKALLTSKLPHDCVEYFSHLAQRIVLIGACLPPLDRCAFHPADTLELLVHSQILSMACRFSADQAARQMAKLEFITQLAPFTINPSPDDLNLNYRQMVSLITT